MWRVLIFSILGEAVYQEEVWRFHKPDLQEIGVLVMVHVNIELWYKEISSQEKAHLLSIYWPNCLQRHLWGFISEYFVGTKYLAGQNQPKMESPMSSLATELLEEILRHLELCHLLHAQLVCKRWAEVELIIISLNWQASQIVAKQHLTPFLLSRDWSVQRHLHKEVNTKKATWNWLTKGYTCRTGMRTPIGPLRADYSGFKFKLKFN